MVSLAVTLSNKFQNGYFQMKLSFGLSSQKCAESIGRAFRILRTSNRVFLVMPNT